jgi:hypothetical protein
MSTYKYCIIGFGISGQILLLEMIKANVSKKDIVICDENFIGGDLITKYGSVLSNTPWWKTKKALEVYTNDIPDFPLDKCTLLRDIVKACLKTALKVSEGVDKLTTKVISIEPEWNIKHLFGSFTAEKVFLTIGAVEKNIDISLPKIPLEIALDKNQLVNHIDPDDKITVFGTSHSGTIVLDNLNQLNIPTTAIYKGQVPFVFEKETHGGLKEASEIYARSILNGEYINTNLLSLNDSLAVYKTLLKTTKIICAIGFETRSSFGKEYTDYNPNTAEINAGKNIYGFGIAYPGISTIDSINYPNVSVLSFQEQIQRCLPACL